MSSPKVRMSVETPLKATPTKSDSVLQSSPLRQPNPDNQTAAKSSPKRPAAPTRLEDIVFESPAELRANARLVSRSEGWNIDWIAQDVHQTFNDYGVCQPSPSVHEISGFLAGRNSDSAPAVAVWRWLEMYREERGQAKSKRRVLLEQWVGIAGNPSGLNISS